MGANQPLDRWVGGLTPITVYHPSLRQPFYNVLGSFATFYESPMLPKEKPYSNEL